MDLPSSSQVAFVNDAQPRIELGGTIDVFVARELLESAKSALAAPGDVVVNCAALERLDTSALQILLALEREIAQQGRRLALTVASDPIRTFLGFAGAAHLLFESELPAAAGGPAAGPADLAREANGGAVSKIEPSETLDADWPEPDVPLASQASSPDRIAARDSHEEALTFEERDGEPV